MKSRSVVIVKWWGNNYHIMRHGLCHCCFRGLGHNEWRHLISRSDLNSLITKDTFLTTYRYVTPWAVMCLPISEDHYIRDLHWPFWPIPNLCLLSDSGCLTSLDYLTWLVGVLDRDQGLLNKEKYLILSPWNFSWLEWDFSQIPSFNYLAFKKKKRYWKCQRHLINNKTKEK